MAGATVCTVAVWTSLVQDYVHLRVGNGVAKWCSNQEIGAHAAFIHSYNECVPVKRCEGALLSANRFVSIAHFLVRIFLHASS